MAWINREADVVVDKELDYESNRIDKTDAYEVEITEAYLQKGKDSDSMSVVISIKNDEGNEGKTYFTIMGRDGKTYFESTVGGKPVKKQHFGLNIVNTLFEIVLGKEIFDVEPSEVEYKVYDKEAKEYKTEKGDGFPELIGQKVGVCYQMYREINGTDSKEYGQITHFFDPETGLFANEEPSDKTKLDKWLKGAKEYIVKEVEAPKRTSFGKKKDEPSADGEPAPKRKWGRK